ncbi:MAG: YncE family protein [Chitinophagaceae bacterium]
MPLFLIIPVCLVLLGCQGAASVKSVTTPVIHDSIPLNLVLAADSVLVSTPVDTVVKPSLAPYSNIVYEKTEVLKAAPGTKSVLFNGDGSRLYAMNLEGMSIYEFDQHSRSVKREFKFTPTKGTGWDYTTDKPISSYEEKPVEACLSHDDKILWVSLHNAEGIVPIRVDDKDENEQQFSADHHLKKITVSYPGQAAKDSFWVPLVKTGKTPKVISKTADDKHLLVSNWHSYTVSVLEMDTTQFPAARMIDTIQVAAIPRGIAIDDDEKKSYVAIMGGSVIDVINNETWEKEEPIQVVSNPRHIVADTAGRLFVSYNKLAKIACVDPSTGKTLFTATTHAQPRTLILSKNQQFLFVTCYSSDFVDVYKINDTQFEKVASLPCKGHPVCVDIFDDDSKLEAWVCSYTNGLINVFSFKKK